MLFMKTNFLLKKHVNQEQITGSCGFQSEQHASIFMISNRA